VEARGLAYHHGRAEHRGFGPVDLDAEPGMILGVLGPNGAGKSTLLRVAATVLEPGAGTLRLLGEDAVPPRAALRRRLGWGSDEPVHFDALTGEENAAFFTRAVTGRHDTALVAHWLETFRLTADAHRPVRTYSLGMRRKLQLAEVFAPRPPLVLLDEPTLGLDAPSLEVLQQTLSEHARPGGTAVLATNDVGFAAATCTRVLFLHEGRMALEGEPAALLARLGATTTFQVSIAAAAAPRLNSEFEVVSASAELVRVRSASGTSALPRLCQTLVEQDVRIRAIQVLEPDLRDVFRLATGADWPTGTAEDQP
jgi:ABC-2 type transport system ATP-binding protein